MRAIIVSEPRGPGVVAGVEGAGAVGRLSVDGIARVDATLVVAG